MIPEEFRIALTDYMGDYFADFGFVVIEGDTNLCSLVHENDDLRLTIFFSKTDRYEGMVISKGSEFILFKNVERIWLPLSVKYKLYDVATPPVEPGYTFRNYDDETSKSFNERFLATRIDKTEDIPEFSKLLKEYLEQISFPFFEKYSRLEAVNEFMDTTDDRANAPYFIGPHFCKKIIIKKLCNAPNYESYLEHWTEFIKTIVLKGETDQWYSKYVSYLKALEELKIILQNH